ncbi:hypothetical protein BJ970_000138 [Saccharopolyspora phatthalungensis]|uniref:Uncharacterized protein n=1 Tax=Saccharopolyspora phatthalungensis TaxID=664693 RepID=A0A840PXF2_9PSEU|nr:hypothetical protein [Saccharopolyspora phatthalungensis]
MSSPVSAWFTVSGQLYDGPWYPGFFQPLRHRLGPEPYKITLDGRVFFFSLCGSPVLKGPASQRIDKCPKCCLHP